MKAFLIIGFIILVLIAGFFILNKNPSNQISPSPNPTLTPAASALPTPTNITATFKIITGNINRSFANSKYHNKSDEVYIEAANPSLVYVKKSGITWADFFNTLPMKLTKNCLTTGDGETYCDQKDGNLEFFLNEKLSPDLLDMEIKNGDSILVKFTP